MTIDFKVEDTLKLHVEPIPKGFPALLIRWGCQDPMQFMNNYYLTTMLLFYFVNLIIVGVSKFRPRILTEIIGGGENEIGSTTDFGNF